MRRGFDLADKHILVTASPSRIIAQAEIGSTILLPNALQQFDAVAQLMGRDCVTRTPDWLSVNAKDTGAAFAQLTAAGIDTRQVQVRDGRLEDVYLHLLGKDVVK